MGIALLGATWVSPARAADSAEARAAAQVLFDQGKDLVKAGKFAEACPKFEESQRLDPRIGTQFNLADCFEHIGRTASAWTNFVDVAASTKAAGQADREQVVRARVAVLERKLSRVTVKVDGASTTGLHVTRDGTEIGQALWGTPVPIDPGEHKIEATAPGKIAWKSTFTVGATSSTSSVSVPALADDPAAFKAPDGDHTAPLVGPVTAPPGPGPDQVPPGSGTGQRVAGGVLGGVGIAGIVVGSIFGTTAKSRLDESRAQCRTATLCTQAGLDLVNQAKSAATVSTIGIVAGGALLVGGLVVFLTAPSGAPKPPSARFVPLLGPGVAGGTFMGAF
ncbi:MAG: hypothetical protein ABJE95_11145 [Byssovorax sp.]